MKNVTIMTDASFCPNTGAAGYAFWITGLRGKFGYSNRTREPVEDSCAAEMMAVVASVIKARSKVLIGYKDTVLIQTDCVDAIETFKGRRPRASEAKHELVNKLMRLESELECKIKFRHIKAHTGKKAKRFVSNDICDRQARKHMRRMRKTLEKQGRYIKRKAK